MHQPARKITNTGSKKNIGKFPSLKTQTTVWYESLLERDYFYLLEIDPDVVSFRSQPLKVQFTQDGRERTYTPDVLVERAAGIQIVEVKPFEKANSEKNRNLFRQISDICEDHGWQFIVVTEKVIRVQPQLSNVKLLCKYSRVQFTLQNLIEIQKYFQYREKVLLKDMEEDLSKKGVGRREIFRSLFFGLLETDLMQPINSNSYLSLSSVPKSLEELKLL